MNIILCNHCGKTLTDNNSTSVNSAKFIVYTKDEFGNDITLNFCDINCHNEYQTKNRR
jgi:hypothetical protein